MKSVFSNKKSFCSLFFLRYNIRSIIRPNLSLFIATTRYFALKCRLTLGSLFLVSLCRAPVFHSAVNHSRKRSLFFLNKNPFVSIRACSTIVFHELACSLLPGMKVSLVAKALKCTFLLFRLFYATSNGNKVIAFFALIQLKQKTRFRS